MAKLGIVACAYAFAPVDEIQTQSISIPYYDNQAVFLAQISPPAAEMTTWGSFIRRHGGWSARVNSLTGLIHRAWGGAIHVGVPAGEASARDLALTFLRNEQDALSVPVSDLEPVSATHHGRHWFVEFKQKYDGLDVFESKVAVRISDRGNIVLFGCDYYPGITTSPVPAISADAARNAATAGIQYGPEDKIMDQELIVLPIPGEDRFIYHLAYRMEVVTARPACWLTIVDANSGQVLYRKDLIDYYSLDGYVDGMIYPATPFDSLIALPFAHEYVRFPGLDSTLTDTSGYFHYDAPDLNPRDLRAALNGEFVYVLNDQGAEAALRDTITPGETLQVSWTTANSRHDERNCYFHVNVIHSFIKLLDPGFEGLDYPLICNVNLNQTCNAYWDGSSINFFMRGGGCENTGEIADVIYHEYGHGITDFQYRPYSPSGAEHEGWSDYTAATITNQPLIGRGFQGEGSYLRTVDNNNRYPDDWVGEPHTDGLIISGALWDLRESLAPRTSYCDSLFNFARYGHSNNYEDYLVDVLEFDDDDDNLYNGTPNSDLIYAAFDLHGIGPGDRITIEHEPLPDTLDDSHPYAVTATVATTITPVDDDSVFVVYRTARDQGYLRASMLPTPNPGEFLGNIPAQPLGTLIEYYIWLTDLNGRVFTHPISAPLPTHFFVIGQLAIQRADSLERVSGWTAGAPGDNATTGIWTRCDPIGTYSDNDPEFPYQPEDDHTPAPGIYCYVTGQQPTGNPDNGANDVDGGQTTLLTPDYDISTYDNPVIEYYRWFTDRTNFDDTFYVDISSDGGTNWLNLEMVTTTQNYWKKCRFLVSQFVDQAAQIRLRFIAEDRGSGSIVEGGIDDLTLYSFVPTSIRDEASNSVPAIFALRPNYPNPFNGKTEIAFNLPTASDVDFAVYDVAGRLVYNDRLIGLAAGPHAITWNGHGDAGSEVATGIYLYKIQAGDLSQTRKMLLLK
jgi:hypothetical protein